MPAGKKAPSGVEGAFSAALHAPNKLAILSTPNQFERFVFLADFAATLLQRGLIDKQFYRRIVTDDPIRSLARQAQRAGTTEWARQIYRIADATVPVASASRILGVEPESGRPVYKKEVGVPDEDLHALLRGPDILSRKGAAALRASPPAPRVMEDGVSLHPDAITPEPRSGRPRRRVFRWNAPTL